MPRPRANPAPPRQRVLDPSWTSVLPFLVGLASFAALAAFNQARGFDLWRNYALSGVLLGSPVTYVLYRFDVRLPHYVQWAIVGALLLHYGGGSVGSPDPYQMGLLGTHGINGAYHTYEWWDNLTHGFGLLAAAMGLAYLLEVYQVRRALHWHASSVLVVTILATLAVGVGVELYEFLGKTAFQTIDQGGYVNTVRDLHFNVLGAVTGAAFATGMHRSRFRARIMQQWAPAARRMGPGHRGPGRARRALLRTPSAMAGLVVFVTIPAITSLYVATAFFFRSVPADEQPLYDAALGLLTLTAAAAAVAGPLAAATHAAWARREA